LCQTLFNYKHKKPAWICCLAGIALRLKSFDWEIEDNKKYGATFSGRKPYSFAAPGFFQ